MIATCKLDHIIVDDNNIEIVVKFIFLGVLISNDGVTDKELRRSLAMGKCAMGSLERIFKDRGIRLTTKIMIVQTLVFPIILHGPETCTLKKADRKTIDAYELWWLALTFFGHVVISYMMELQMMLGRIEGRRGIGRTHCTLLDNIKKYFSKYIMSLRLDARDRTGCRIATMDVASVGFDSTSQGNNVINIILKNIIVIYIILVYE